MTTTATPTRRRSPERLGFLLDVMTTAVEGGIGYWSRLVDAERGTTEPATGWERADYLAWRSVTVVDYIAALEDVDGIESFADIDDPANEPRLRAAGVVHTVTLDALASALRRLEREPVKYLHENTRARLIRASRTNDAGDIDAGDADLIFQLAALGEWRYA